VGSSRGVSTAAYHGPDGLTYVFTADLDEDALATGRDGLPRTVAITWEPWRVPKPFGPRPATSSRSLPPSGLRNLHLPHHTARYARVLALGLARWSAAGEAGGLPTRLIASR